MTCDTPRPRHVTRGALFLVVTTLCAAVCTLLGAAPASAVPSAAPGAPGAPPSAASGGGGARYVALGDSWAAGTGAGPADPDSGGCRRSAAAYPAVGARLHSTTDWTSAACVSTGPGSSQLSTLRPETELVTVTIGGDATNLAGAATACSLGREPAGCDQALDRFRRTVAGPLGASLDRSLDQVRSGTQRAAVLVTGYPQLGPGICADGPAPGRGAQLDQAIGRLNDTIAERTRAHGMTFVDVGPAFAGHGVCSPVRWVDGVRSDERESFHPNAAGHRSGYVPALETARAPSTVPSMPPPSPPRRSGGLPGLLGDMLGAS